jgi:hypothetical protein
MRRAWYLGGIAILAAALSDPLVESLANRGWLGGAVRYADNDHASVIPALLAGLVVALGVSLRRGLQRDRTDWTDIAWIVGLQFIVLFVMENAEQFGVSGTFGGDGLWLGGPPVAALAVHTIAGMFTALLAGRVVDGIADALASIVRAVIALAIAITARAEVRFFARLRDICLRRRHRDFAPQIGGRAPPLSAAY